ncbi:MAG TPA: substrate-binding domain-containing protein [Stellaceae bacterium]|nr:substrate-binding domain-containing protein [Stellaceae bacterium]
MTRFLLAALILCALVLFVGQRLARAEDKFVTLASTTSVDNSGLLTHILPLFKQASGIDVHVVALGTGQALDVARRGDADLVLVHDPDAEQKFIDEGHGVNRREIAWNDFIIVGPGADPAKLKGGRDVVAAFKSIWSANAPFVSRGDKSGTDALEKRLWKAADLDITKAGAWYKDIGGGMGAALNAAAGMDAYTLSDRGTWLSFNNRRDLAILLEGDARLINRYDVIELSPKLHGQAKLALAKQFADWLASLAGQQAIGDYELAGQKLFHPEADKKP